MAFTGVATTKLVADGIVRITGLSLAAGATGTISLSVGTGQVKCPAEVIFKPYVAADGGTVGSVDAIDVSVKSADAGAPSAVSVSVVKSGGPDAASFLATLQNQNSGSASANLEIYLKIHS